MGVNNFESSKRKRAKIVDKCWIENTETLHVKELQMRSSKTC